MSERSGTSLLDQLASYGSVLDRAAQLVDADADAGEREVIELEPVRRRMLWPLAGVAATIVVVVIGALLLTRGSGTEPHPLGPPALPAPAQAKELGRVDLDNVLPWEIAFDGHDVWTAQQVIEEGAAGVGYPAVRVIRRDANTGVPLTTVDVPQESVNAIAVDDDRSVYVAGGGDGGVPRTTVSKIDPASNSVVFTTTLTEPCSCQLVAGAAGIWLGGNGRDVVYRLEPGTGKIATTVQLPAPAMSMAVVGDLLEVGLRDSRVVVVDPASEEVVRTIDLKPSAQGAAGPVTALTAIDGSGLPTSWAVSVDGSAFLITDNARVTKTYGFVPPVTSATHLGGALYVLGTLTGPFVIQVHSDTGGPISLVKVQPLPGDATNGGIRSVVAAGDVLWVTDTGTNPSTVIVRPPRHRPK